MGTRIKKLSKERAALFETSVHRRLALKLIAGTAATTTLAACGVNPAPMPQPHVRTNTVVLRGRLLDLSGRNLERLRAIAAFLDPVNRSKVDILGEYWAVDELIVQGKPGRDFVGDGIDMVVIAKGESAAAVREWAAQWAGVLDFDGDEAEAIDPVYPAQVTQAGGPTFLVFERRAGAVAPKAVLEAHPGGVYVVSHHVLVNDRRRQVLVVRAPSREAVRGWVEQWGHRQAIEVLELTHLSEQLRRCARSTSCGAEAAALVLPAVKTQAGLKVADYHPNGFYSTSDQRLGTYYFRHQATGRFLSIDGSGKVLTVPIPSTGDRWTFSKGSGLDCCNYSLQHQGTGLYLSSDGNLNVTSSSSPQTWQGGQWYFGGGGILSADSNGNVNDRGTTDSSSNWAQWTDYNQPSALEQTVGAIVSGTTHDAPWPEDSYSGDLLAAYNDILTSLGGLAPKNGNVTTAQLDAARLQVLQKFNNALPPAYATVFEHLYAELSYLDILNTWYGDGGHVQTLLTETTINNLALINTVQNLASPPAGVNVKFEVATFISLAAIAIASLGLGPAGGVIGAVLAGAWRLYSSATGGANDTLNTTFANLDAGLSATFNALITKREDVRSAVAGNWGKLSTFAGLVADGTLVWPSDTSQVRAAAARQFEISVWQSVSGAIWIISGGGSEDQDRPDESQFLNSPWVYITQVFIQFKPNKDVVNGWATDESYIPASYAPNSTAQHLFDDSNGGLGVSMTDFYLSKNGWAIPPDQG